MMWLLCVMSFAVGAALVLLPAWWFGLIALGRTFEELRSIEAENLANGIELPIMPPVDVLGITEPKATPSAAPLRNLAAADVQVAGPRLELRLWSSLLVLARCTMDDVVIASFPDTPEGMERATERAQEVLRDPEREWNSWQADDSEFIKSTVVRVTDGGSTGLWDFFFDEDDPSVILSSENNGPELVAWTPDKGSTHGRTHEEAKEDSATAAAAEQSAPSGAAAATAAGS